MIEMLVNVPVSIMYRKRENRFINNTGVYEMVKGKNQHVIPYKGKWVVKEAGNKKSTVVLPTQKEAIAEEIARNQGSDTKIHGFNRRS